MIGGAVAGESFGVFGDQYFFADNTSSKIWQAPLTATRDGFTATPSDFVTGADGPVGPHLRPRREHVLRGDQRRRGPPGVAELRAPAGSYSAVYAARYGAGGVRVAEPHARVATQLPVLQPARPDLGEHHVGTPDANGAAAQSTGSVRLTVLSG